MRHASRCFAMSCFPALCLGVVLAALSAYPAQAGQTITINGNVNKSVYGNSPDGDPSSTNYGTLPSGNPFNLRDPNNNTVIVNSATVTGNVTGGDGIISGSAMENNVTVNSGGAVTDLVQGGYASSTAASVTVSRNAVAIGGSVAGDVYGGKAYSEMSSPAAEALHNSVIVNGGSVGGNVIGGYAETSGAATASYNSVTINGGRVDGNVFGGRAYNGGVNTATHNTVTIRGNPVFAPSVSILHGGDIGGSGDAWTGNTLDLHSPISVGGVKSFQYLNFYLPPTMVAGGAMLTIGSGGAADITDSTVNVGIDGASTPLGINDTITLIDASAGTLTGASENSTANGEGMQGVTLKYEFGIAADNDAGLLTATVTGIGTNERAKALSEGFLSGLALLNQGADLVAGQGMGSAVGVGGNGLGVFAALSGGWSRYKTGSHVDMNSVSIMTGLAWGGGPGRLTLGAFVEFGNGVYDTHNSFSNATVAGDGDAHYLGGGILGRMDFTNFGPGRFYTEASARAGGIRNEYHASGLRDGMGRSAGYDSSSAYYGLHLGAGYVWNISEKASLDLHGKYFWTRQQGDSVTLATNDPVSFESADSHRLRLGARFAYAASECVSPYIGAAYEREFDGEARAETYGYSIGAPSLRGGTGMAEIGVALKPSRSLPLSLDLGVRGYAGKREGVTGSLRIKFDF